MDKIIIEVGSTVTKIYHYNGQNVKDLGFVTIHFKKNYMKRKQMDPHDIELLVDKIRELKKIAKDVLVLGTSIFRDLNNQEREDFIKQLKDQTGAEFKVISQEEENKFTVCGVVRNINKKVAVFVGGGGSTEISVFDEEIIEMVNSNIGVMDIMEQYPDLAEDLAITDMEKVKSFIKSKLNIPKQKVDILVLAGGGHKLFALESGINYEKNILYQDELQPIMMGTEKRKEDTKKYFTKISLDDIRNKVEDPKWWYATRAMCAFVLVVAEAMDVKYIVPTDISMIYGVVDQLEKKERI